MITEPIDTLARIQEASFTRASEATRGAFPPERRMDGARLLSFLARKRYAVLATTRPGVRNLKHEPHASLVIDEDESERHGVVIVDGTTRLLQPLEAGLEMRAPFRDDAGTFPDWIGVLIVLTPERLLSYAAQGFQG